MSTRRSALQRRATRGCVNVARRRAPATQGLPEVHSNVYETDGAQFKLPLVLAAAAKGAACFDCPYYAQSNPDIPETFDCDALFDHYINHGQFEGRPFKCALRRCIPSAAPRARCQRRSTVSSSSCSCSCPTVCSRCRYTCEVPEAELLPVHAQPGALLPQLSAERMAELMAGAQASADGAGEQVVPPGRRVLGNAAGDTWTANSTRTGAARAAFEVWDGQRGAAGYVHAAAQSAALH